MGDLSQASSTQDEGLPILCNAFAAEFKKKKERKKKKNKKEQKVKGRVCGRHFRRNVVWPLSMQLMYAP